MIGVPFEFAPSSLLHYEQTSLHAQVLLESSSAFLCKYEWLQAEHCILEAQEFCEGGGDHLCSAIVQLHLMGFYSYVGELGQAIEQCKNAYQTLRRQPAYSQRHNEAMAAYGLGLLQELLLLVDDRQGLPWYRKALQQLEAVQDHWAEVNDPPRFESCQRVRKWIQSRIERIVESRADWRSQHPGFDVWRLDSADRPFNRPDGVRGYIIGDDRVLIEDTYYRPEPAVDIGEDHPNYYFALPLQKDRLRIPEGETGDYMLIRQQWRADEEELGVIWESGRGWEAVNFTRGSDGEFRFDSPARKVIGGNPTGKLKGYVVAMLRPAPSTSPSSGVSDVHG